MSSDRAIGPGATDDEAPRPGEAHIDVIDRSATSETDQKAALARCGGSA
jgi:hypothetical protein